VGGKKIIILTSIIAIILLFGAGGFYFLKFRNKPIEKTQAQQEKNYFEINDEASGIYFKVSKKFERMPARDLQIKNPNFIYGFSAADDKNVNCYISQTKRESDGQITVGKLRDGVFEQVKKTFSDAKLDSQEIVEVGENNNKGAKLKISYVDGDIPKLQWEVAGITQKNAVFAFCELPQAVVDLYKDSVDLFLDSLNIK